MKKYCIAVVAALWLAGWAHGQVTSDTKASSKNAKAEKELIKLCRDWDNAYIKRDGEALKNILGDDYLGIDDFGSVITKADEITLTQSGDFVLISVAMDEPIKIRVYGSAAVVTTCATLRQQYQGKDMSGQIRSTSVWSKRGNRWQVVSWHGSRVKQDASKPSL
jgi:ketosteroid isomerase-like protein